MPNDEPGRAAASLDSTHALETIEQSSTPTLSGKSSTPRLPGKSSTAYGVARNAGVAYKSFGTWAAGKRTRALETIEQSSTPKVPKKANFTAYGVACTPFGNGLTGKDVWIPKYIARPNPKPKTCIDHRRSTCYHHREL